MGLSWGREEETFWRKFPPPLPRTPSSPPSKTFDFIESLFAAFPVGEEDEERLRILLKNRHNKLVLLSKIVFVPFAGA